MSEATFTVPEFHQQVVEFRQMFGNREFWKKPADQRRVAVDALSFAYLFLKHDTTAEDIQHCADLLSQTIGEYQQRELKLIELGVVHDAA